MSSPAQEHPFAVWTVFRDAHRWWFARGCPPPVRPLRGWPRALHLTVLIAAAGLMAAIVGACILAVMNPLPPWDSILFGGIFSSVVLVPLSRWLDRAWWWSLLAVPFTVAWFWCADAMLYPRAPAYREELFMVAATFLIASGPALWVISWKRPHTWWSLVAIVLACVTASAAASAQLRGTMGSWLPTGVMLPMTHFILNAQPLILFLTLTAAALGIPLWRDDTPPTPEPGETAPTEPTS